MLEPVPRYVATIPFLGTALMLLLTQLVSRYVSGRLHAFLETKIESADVTGKGKMRPLLPIEMQPGTLRQRFEWGMDVVTSVTAIVLPVIGVVLLDVRGVASNVGIVLLGVFFVSTALLFFLLSREPGAYEALSWPRGRSWTLSFLTRISIAVNILAALVAYLLAAKTYVGIIR